MMKLFGYRIDDVLRRRAIDRKIAPLALLGLVVASTAVGAGIGLAFAPSSGRRLRQDMIDRLEQMRGRIKGELRKETGVNATTQR